MKKKVSPSKYLILLSIFFATITLYANELNIETLSSNKEKSANIPIMGEFDAEELIASWSQLHQARTENAGQQIFDQAIVRVPPLRYKNPAKAAQLFFKAAEFCRDLNDVKHTITLFERALEIDPENPHYRRVYGDYLIGYRGLEEHAWAQLYEARQFAETYPEELDDDFWKTLNRSIHIFRRDTSDGAITFERSQSDGALIYENKNITITGGFDALYGKLAKDSLGLSTDYFRVRDYNQAIVRNTIAGDQHLENLLIVNGGTVGSRDEILDVGTLSDGSPITINNLQSRNASARANAQSQLDVLESDLKRQIESSETFASFLLRTPNSNLPAVRLSYFNTYSFNSSTNLEDLYEPYDRVADLVALELEKTFILKDSLFLEGDIGLFYQNQQSRNDDFAIEDDYFLNLTTALNLRQEWRADDGILSLNIGGTYNKDLYNFEAYPVHQQIINFRRFSFLEEPSDNKNRQRFRGRRTRSQSTGLARSERRFEPTGKAENWRFFISNAELGLMDGKLDIYTTYTYRERNLLDVEYGEGNYSVHTFNVEPVWVPVFELYEDDFVDGWEFATVGFPIRFDKDDGPYDGFGGGLTIRGQYVISQAKLTLGISVGVEYNHYTEVDEGDLGGFIRFSIF